MTDNYLHFIITHYGLYGNAPVHGDTMLITTEVAKPESIPRSTMSGEASHAAHAGASVAVSAPAMARHHWPRDLASTADRRACAQAAVHMSGTHTPAITAVAVRNQPQ